MRPLIPYLELPDLVLLPAGTLGRDAGPVSVKPFGVLVAAGVYIGAALALRYGRRRGLTTPALTSFIVWVVVSGFVAGHVLDVVFYAPGRIAEDPWSLLRLYDGLSSYGGFIGGVIGALLWKLRHRTHALPYADVVASALPMGWVFGRAGCAVVHDHPGIASDAWYAVAYPGGGRVDLGLVEMVLSLPLAVVFVVLQRRAWPWGFFVCVLSLVYAPLRFLLDFWRIREPALIAGAWVEPDARYFALTPAQWASLALFAFGAALAARVFARPPIDALFLPPTLPAAFAPVPRAASDPDLDGSGEEPSSKR